MNFTVEEYLDLLKGADQVTGSKLYRMGEAEVSGITYESEKAGPGSLFICKGALFKKEYLEEAVSRGSICYVSERDYGLEQVPCILVDVYKRQARRRPSEATCSWAPSSE